MADEFYVKVMALASVDGCLEHYYSFHWKKNQKGALSANTQKVKRQKNGSVFIFPPIF